MLGFHDVSLTIKGKVLIKDFNLTVKKGETIHIQGPSGTGKTSLLHLLMGLKVPDKGRVTIAGRELSGHYVWSCRKLISYVDQGASPGQGRVDQLLTNLFQLKAIAHIQPGKEQWFGIFQQLALEEQIFDKNIQALSGGERQRLVLAIAIMLDRPIWLLDEPTSSLDAALKQTVVKLVMAKPERTVVVVSHDDIWKTESGLIGLTWEAGHGVA